MAGSAWEVAKAMFPELRLDEEETPPDNADAAALAIAVQATPPVNVATSFSPGLLQGLQQGEAAHFSALLPHVATALHQLKTQGIHSTAESAKDPPIPKVAKFFLQSASRLHTSKEALGQLLAVDPTTVEGALSIIAAILVLCDRADRHALEALICKSGCECLMYVDLNKYDETPMVVTVKQPLSFAVAAASPPPEASQEPVAAPPLSQLGAHPAVAKQATKSKLFAVDHSYAMLLKLPQDLASPSGQYVTFIGKTLSWLQVLERASAPILQKALAAVSAVGPHSQSFDLQCRITTTDAASENFLAEKHVMADRDESWTALHFVCVVHQISSMVTFREHLGQLVRERLLIIRGYPLEEASAYRRFILRLFCTTGRQLQLREFLLSALPNGDWRRSDAIELYIAPGIDFNQEQVTQRLVNGLVVALSGRVFSTYPQSRWIGCDVGVDEAGLCEAVHRLLSLSFARMMGRLDELSLSGGTDYVRCQEEEEEEPGIVQATAWAQRGATSRGRRPAEGSADADESTQPDRDEQRAATPALTDVSAEAMAKRRKIAWEWLRSDPLPYLMLLRMGLRPMTNLLRSYITRSGDRWEQEARAQEAARLLQGHASNNLLRRTAFSEFVRGVSEKQFFKELGEVRDSEDWQYFPTRVWTLQFQALAFRLLSRMGSIVRQLMVLRAETYPARLFRLLWETLLTWMPVRR